MNLASFALVFVSVSLSALAQTAFKLGVSRVAVTPDMSVIQKALGFLLSPYVIGGLALSAVLTLLIIPPLMSLFAGALEKKHRGAPEAATQPAE